MGRAFGPFDPGLRGTSTCRWARPDTPNFGFSSVAHRARTGDGFDERRTGMDHLAFTVADRAALQRWAARPDELEIAHFAPAAAIGGEVIVFRDPDNIQLQLWAPAPSSTPSQ